MKKKLNIDWDLVVSYLEKQSPGTAIACMIGISAQCLYERCLEDNGITFSEFRKMHQQVGAERLRQKMYEQAMTGDKTLMIFLAKNYLGMAEKVDAKVESREWRVSYDGFDPTVPEGEEETYEDSEE